MSENDDDSIIPFPGCEPKGEPPKAQNGDLTEQVMDGLTEEEQVMMIESKKRGKGVAIASSAEAFIVIGFAPTGDSGSDIYSVIGGNSEILSRVLPQMEELVSRAVNRYLNDQ